MRNRIDEAGLTPVAGDQISQTVARVWQQVLLVPVRAAEDDFFDSGGDSLTAITFVIELERALGLESHSRWSTRRRGLISFARR